MQKTDLNKIPQMSIEQVVALPMEDLLGLSQEANVILAEAKGIKSWIDGIINFKNSINENNKNDSINGGQNEQVIDY